MESLNSCDCLAIKVEQISDFSSEEGVAMEASQKVPLGCDMQNLGPHSHQCSSLVEEERYENSSP